MQTIPCGLAGCISSGMDYVVFPEKGFFKQMCMYHSLICLNLSGVQPVGEKWSEECILALQQRVSNRILCVKIQGAHEGRALVAMIDKGSDPQGNVAELLTSAGFAAPVAVTTSSNQQDDHKTPAEVHGEMCLQIL